MRSAASSCRMRGWRDSSAVSPPPGSEPRPGRSVSDPAELAEVAVVVVVVVETESGSWTVATAVVV